MLLGNGDGTFQPAVSYSSGGWRATSVAVADVNGDGNPDLVVSSECQSGNNCNYPTGPGGRPDDMFLPLCDDCAKIQ